MRIHLLKLVFLKGLGLVYSLFHLVPAISRICNNGFKMCGSPSMGPEDGEELSSRIFQVARDSTDEQTLEAGLWEVIDDFSNEIGRATAMHEATSFLFNNNARHFSFSQTSLY